MEVGTKETLAGTEQATVRITADPAEDSERRLAWVPTLSRPTTTYHLARLARRHEVRRSRPQPISHLRKAGQFRAG